MDMTSLLNKLEHVRTLMELSQIDEATALVKRNKRYVLHRLILHAILSDRFFSNPIDNKSIVRYVWDLHAMNYN